MSLGTNLHVAGHEVSFGLCVHHFGAARHQLAGAPVRPSLGHLSAMAAGRCTGSNGTALVFLALAAGITAGAYRVLMNETCRWRRWWLWR